MSAAQSPRKASNRRLNRLYAFYTLGFLGFVLILALLEQLGLPRKTMGYIFLLATVLLYAAIGIMSRTSDVVEYYVAGRRIPAMFNGMATGADWMSGASFVALAGGLYLSGYSGLAYVMGWTGGYVLVALLLAPYLRKFGQFTIPDFLGARYGGVSLISATRVLLGIRKVNPGFFSVIWVQFYIHKPTLSLIPNLWPAFKSGALVRPGIHP